eukprot:SAG22_NODE_638_length_8262_cov_4.658826_7_plen_104_part_00
MDDGGGEDVRTSYTSEFLESVSDLPMEMKKSYNLIKDLDEYMHEMVDGAPNTEQLGVEQMKKKILAKVRALPRGRGWLGRLGTELLPVSWAGFRLGLVRPRTN